MLRFNEENAARGVWFNAASLFARVRGSVDETGALGQGGRESWRLGGGYGLLGFGFTSEDLIPSLCGDVCNFFEYFDLLSVFANTLYIYIIDVRIRKNFMSLAPSPMPKSKSYPCTGRGVGRLYIR